MREDGRQNDEIRNVKITKDYLKHPTGSVLIEMGDTKVICSAMIEDKVPHFLRGCGKGWITAEYSMLPSSTHTRKIRESSKGKIEGRTQEIQRLIGRALRSVVDLEKLGEKTIWIDCDVIQADGGTRTASITGAFVALADALGKLYKDNIPLKGYLSAVSVGVVKDEVMLDLCYTEDFKAKVDMNIVMTDSGEFVELQGTGEDSPFSLDELNELIRLGQIGTKDLIEKQKEVLGDVSEMIGRKSIQEKSEVNK